MRLQVRTIEKLTAMVCGDAGIRCAENFMYRSSSELTRFFANSNTPFRHDGSWRSKWVQGVLSQLNEEVSSSEGLPSDSLVSVIEELMDKDYFGGQQAGNRPPPDRALALADLNEALERESLCVFLDDAGKSHLSNTGTGAIATDPRQRNRPLSRQEAVQKAALGEYLDAASEDQFTTRVLVPLFQRLGFQRVEVAGHREKILEYGKDLWMKLPLRTGHFLYFAAQIKKGKIDSQGSGSRNVTELLNQARMALGHEVFDPEVGRKVLVDHVFLISGDTITKSARNWLIGELDREQRRQIIFMDREELLNHAAQILADLQLNDSPGVKDEFPF